MTARTDAVTQMAPQPFRQGLLELDPIRLVGARCLACTAHTFPVRPVCPSCRGTEMERVALGTSATVYTFTVVRQAPAGTSVPYVLAQVDLPDGVRVLTQIDISDPADVAIGMHVELTARSMGSRSDGTPLIGYQFAPTTATEVTLDA